MSGPSIQNQPPLIHLHGQQPLDELVQVHGAGELNGHHVQIVDQPDHELQLEVLLPPDQEPPHVPVLQAQLVATRPEARELARETLPDRDSLIERIGAPPKRDITIGGLTLHKMSTGYKEVLDKLDDYHAALARCNEPLDLEMPDEGGHSGAKLDQLRKLLDLSEALQALEHSLKSYEAGGKHTHKDTMRTLLAQVREEMGVVNNALQQVDDLEGHPNVGLNDVIGFQRVHPGLSLDEIGTLVNQGWSVTDYSAMWQMTLDPHGLKESDVREAVRLGYDLDTVRAYHEARLPITEGTRMGAKIDGELTPLGKGAINSVFKGEVELPDGTHMTGVFKAEKPSVWQLAGVAPLAGIDIDRPNGASRNVATYKLNQRLDLGVIPRTEITLYQGQVGNVMELVKGISPQIKGNFSIELPPNIAQFLREHPEALQAYIESKGFDAGELDGNTLKVRNETLQATFDEASNDFLVDENGESVKTLQGRDGMVAMDFGDSVLRRELTKLQWLDALTGQVDRHGQNYFVERTTDGQTVAIKGIDNDMAFGARITDANATSNVGFRALLGEGGSRDLGLKGGLLPSVIDRKTFDALMALSPEQIETDCAGLLSPDEIEATKTRLAQIKLHLGELEQNGGVIETDDENAWSSPEVSKRLGMETSPQERVDRLRERLTHEGLNEHAIKTEVKKLLTHMEQEAQSFGYVARDWMLQELDNMQVIDTPMLDVVDLDEMLDKPLFDDQ